MTSRVVEVHSLEQYLQIFSKAGEKLVVVDFSAKWCGPCHAIAPFLAELSFKYPDVIFVKVDVDEVKEVARGAGVRAMPTFHFFKSNVKVGELVGASREKLEDLVLQHMVVEELTLERQLASGMDLSDILTSAIRKVISQNPRNIAEGAFETLNTLLSNVVKEPSNSKYKKIRIENPKFNQAVWSVPGASQILKYAGFKEGIEYGFLILPDNANMEALYIVQALISSRNDPGSSFYTPAPPQSRTPSRHPTSSSSSSSSSTSTSTSTSSSSSSPSASSTQRNPAPSPANQLTPEAASALAASLAASFANLLPPAATIPADPFATIQKIYLDKIRRSIGETEKERAFFQQLKSHSSQVHFYERTDYQSKALSLIPLAQLQERARANLSPGDDLKPELLRQLLRWFKKDFFTWTDAPSCQMCQGSTRVKGMTTASQAEQAFGASRVELYECSSCGAFTRFPRYNNPSKLLETRTGRCGEWANAFTLCCRALGFEARYVADWTDHVWTEVFIESENRWVHCDPSEAAYDKPLIYEVGWGKGLSFIIAYSKEEVVDVTKKYTHKFKEVATRRKEIREKWLKWAIAQMNFELLSKIPPARADILAARFLDELNEMGKPKAVKSDEKVGRISGSLAWREQRGEVGSQPGEASPSPSVQLGPKLFDLKEGGFEQLQLLGCSKRVEDGGGAIQLTPSANDRVGGAVFRDKVKVSSGFVCDFSFAIKNAGADGFAFVIHNSPDGQNTLGRGGAELGYGGIKNSLAIEFDTFENVDRCDDPNGNHISVHTRGPEGNEAHHSASIGVTKGKALPQLNTGETFHVRLVYEGDKQLLVILITEDLSQPFVNVLSVPLALQKTIRLGNDGKAWIAFTGATGGLAQEQLIFNWRFFGAE